MVSVVKYVWIQCVVVRYGFDLKRVMHYGSGKAVPAKKHLPHWYPAAAGELLDSLATAFEVLHYLEVVVSLLVSLADGLHAKDQNPYESLA